MAELLARPEDRPGDHLGGLHPLADLKDRKAT